MSKVTAEQQAAWSEIVEKKYADQAVWFLNGFWEEMEAQAEDVWKWVELFGQLDQEKHADGCELDEFWSHKFLESLGETMTVIEMREKFRTIDVDFNKRMSLIEFLSYRFKKTIQEVIDAPQGGNQEEINNAQAAVHAAQAAVEEMVARLAEATRTSEAADAAAAEATRTSEAADAAAAEATRTADAANAAAAEATRTADAANAAAAEATRTAEVATAADEEASAKAADAAAKADAAKAAADAAEAVAAPYRAAVAENEKALEELHAEEKAYNDKKAALEQTKSDMSIGVVKRNKAANELDQLMAEDPLPLRKAKINQAATVRKMEKAAKPFNEASEKAKAAAEAAEAASAEAAAAANHAREERDHAEAAKRDADAAAAAADAAKREADETAAAAEAAKAQAEDAAAAAAAAKQQAEDAAAAAAEAKAQSEAAAREAEAMLQAAVDTLNAAKKKGGIAHGSIWWMERTIEEKKKYMPGYKGPRK